MKVGDWVFFKSRNWPKDARLKEVDSDTGEATDITEKELYPGRGQIVGIAGGTYPMVLLCNYPAGFARRLGILYRLPWSYNLPGIEFLCRATRRLQWRRCQCTAGIPNPMAANRLRLPKTEERPV